MKHFKLDDLGRYSDVLLTRQGAVVTVRFAEVGDADALQAYFRRLSPRSRYNRLMGAASGLPVGQLDQFIHLGQAGGYSLLATILQEHVETLIGEARYVPDDATSSVEIGLSIDDSVQGQGIGTALLSNLGCRAAALGAERLFGDTLRTNDAMLGLARKARFGLAPTPGDWKQMRFEKRITSASDLACASARTPHDAALELLQPWADFEL